MTGEYQWLWWVAAAAAALLAFILWAIWRKGRPFTSGDVFRASRLSRGNHIFPTQVAITPTSVVQHTPRWIGKQEQSIHMAHVASVNIDTGILFSNVLIETSGGSDPVRCHGHHKADAIRIKELIERYQTDHYRPIPPSGSGGPAGGGHPPAVPKPIGR